MKYRYDVVHFQYDEMCGTEKSFNKLKEAFEYKNELNIKFNEDTYNSFEVVVRDGEG